MPQQKTPISVHISRFTCSMRDGATCHFVPHEKNGYVPHVLKHRVLLAYSTILILLKILVVVGYSALPVASVFSSAVTTENVIRLTNVARAAAGLPELVPNDRLAVAAANKAADMLEKQYFAHESPEGLTPWYWIKGSGYDYRYAGENLAVHYFSAEGLHEGWMASPTHRQNIVDDRYVDIGIGIAQGSYEDYDTIFVVQMFGRSKEHAAPTEPEPIVPVEEAPVAAVVLADTEQEPSAVAPESVVVFVDEPTEIIAAEPDEDVAGETSPIVAESISGGEDETPEIEPLFPEPDVEVATPHEPFVVESSLKIVPSADGYDVQAVIENAEKAEVFLGPKVATLEDSGNGAFFGSVPLDEDDETGVAQIFLSAEDADGDRIVRSVATVAPYGTTQDLFVTGGKPSAPAKFLGLLEVRALEDKVNRFYVFAIIFLGAALLLKVSVKFHIQRHGVIMHTVAVMVLAGALLLM